MSRTFEQYNKLRGFVVMNTGPAPVPAGQVVEGQCYANPARERFAIVKKVEGGVVRFTSIGESGTPIDDDLLVGAFASRYFVVVSNPVLIPSTLLAYHNRPAGSPVREKETTPPKGAPPQPKEKPR